MARVPKGTLRIQFMPAKPAVNYTLSLEKGGAGDDQQYLVLTEEETGDRDRILQFERNGVIRPLRIESVAGWPVDEEGRPLIVARECDDEPVEPELYSEGED